ncbi:MAG TPA: hypothetical protein DF712_22060 [Balneola sp.]|nr:hypothetical protein [Balneola sp.]|tara:strand:- start:687 stop:869 length:183 start_codon:yes stop_codon:yes gene_type:complete
MKQPKKLLTDLKSIVFECNLLISNINMEDNKSIKDKKTEWAIYQNLKKLGEIDDSNDEPN